MQITRVDPRVSSRYLRILITPRTTRACRETAARLGGVILYRLDYNRDEDDKLTHASQKKRIGCIRTRVSCVIYSTVELHFLVKCYDSVNAIRVSNERKTPLVARVRKVPD